MKYLPFILCLHLALAVPNPQASETSNWIAKAKQRSDVQLLLSTTISEQHYSAEAGEKLLRLTLTLTYTNRGSEPILLDKKSSLVYRKLFSRDLKAASHQKYVNQISSSFIDVNSVGEGGVRLNTTPEEEAFVKLQRGESFSLTKMIILRLYDGTEDTEDNLHPGNYFLQLKVATWYYFANPELYREKWHEQGYLWAEDILSAPMPVTVKPGY